VKTQGVVLAYLFISFQFCVMVLRFILLIYLIFAWQDSQFLFYVKFRSWSKITGHLTCTISSGQQYLGFGIVHSWPLSDLSIVSSDLDLWGSNVQFMICGWGIASMQMCIASNKCAILNIILSFFWRGWPSYDPKNNEQMIPEREESWRSLKSAFLLLTLWYFTYYLWAITVMILILSRHEQQ
jgi:hypothetical protein